MDKGKYYLTTAIAYTSGRPHIGNTYEIVLSDAIARYKREQGYDVFFQTGTDEHGQKIEEKANAAGITPKEFVDGVAKTIRDNFDLMDVSYDYFVRTTDDYHEKQVQKILENFMNKVIFINQLMKVYTVHHVNLSGQKVSWLMENVLTVDVRFIKKQKKPISLTYKNMLNV